MNPLLSRGFTVLRGWVFWLRQGQGNGGVQEIERAALRGGGDGESGHGRQVGVGAVADVVAVRVARWLRSDRKDRTG